MAEPNRVNLAKNPAYRPATEKALETGLFLCLSFRRRLALATKNPVSYPYSSP